MRFLGIIFCLTFLLSSCVEKKDIDYSQLTKNVWVGNRGDSIPQSILFLQSKLSEGKYVLINNQCYTYSLKGDTILVKSLNSTDYFNGVFTKIDSNEINFIVLSNQVLLNEFKYQKGSKKSSVVKLTNVKQLKREIPKIETVSFFTEVTFGGKLQDHQFFTAQIEIRKSKEVQLMLDGFDGQKDKYFISKISNQELEKIEYDLSFLEMTEDSLVVLPHCMDCSLYEITYKTEKEKKYYFGGYDGMPKAFCNLSSDLWNISQCLKLKKSGEKLNFEFPIRIPLIEEKTIEFIPPQLQ